MSAVALTTYARGLKDLLFVVEAMVGPVGPV